MSKHLAHLGLRTFGLLAATALLAQPARGATVVANTHTALGVINYGAEQFRSLILEPAVDQPDFAMHFRITDDIKAKVDVLFVGRMRKTTIKDAGCGSTPTTPPIDTEKVTWDPKLVESWVQECYSDFESRWMAWGLAAGYDRIDLQQAVIKIKQGLEGTEQEVSYWNEFVQTMMEDAIQDDIFRIAYFGNPAITAGQLTGGADDVKNYDQLLGIWPQVIAKGAAVRAATIAANSAGGQALGAGDAITIFRALIDTADERLLSGKYGEPVLRVTRSLARNWRDSRQTQNLETSFKMMADGSVETTFDGYKIMIVPEWDRILREDFRLAGVTDLPHRALFTTVQNTQLGFDAYDKATQTDAWVNKETKYTHRRANFKMDAKVMRTFLTRAAW